MNKCVITGPKIYTENGILHNGSVVMAGKRIHEIKKTKLNEAEYTFPASYHLVPGFIDCHVHGVKNHDVMDGTSDALTAIARALTEEGTTAFLATTMTKSIADIEKTLQILGDVNKNDGAKCLGVHLEGPFISKEKAGAQSAEHILPIEKKYIEKWQHLSGNAIKLVTFAPELPNSLEFITYLKENHIIPAFGHSHATFAETTHAIKAGSHYATHLFNAMRNIHQREPGIALAALLSNDVYTELIVDGIHLHPAMVALVFKLKNPEKILLVTDAMRAKCLTDGEYDLGGQTVLVRKGVPALADGTLAGSVLSMPNAIQNMMSFTGCDFLTALKMATENPAKMLGVFDKKGSIAVHKDADLVVLNEDFQVVLTMCEGDAKHRI